MGEGWIELEALVHATGDAFDQGARTLLAVDGARERLQAELGSTDWRRATTAWILHGRVEHPELHRRIERELDGADTAEAEATCSGLASEVTRVGRLAASEWGEAALPWAWAVVLKRPAVEDWWRRTAVRMITLIPHEGSIAPLVGLILTSDDGALRTQAGAALGNMPREAMRVALVAARTRAEDVRITLHRAQQRLDDRDRER